MFSNNTKSVFLRLLAVIVLLSGMTGVQLQTQASALAADLAQGQEGASKAQDAVGPAGGSPTLDSCGYPYSSSNPLTSVVFNESEVLRGFSPVDAGVAKPGDTIKVWYNDEHALTLGVRQVKVKTSSGTTTTDYPLTPLTTNPGSALDPQTGSNLLSGDQAGTDISARPMWPALFITDITADANNRSGDWQFGGAALGPHAVFGTWKGAVRTVDKTHSPATVSVTPDGDPAKNDWNLDGGDPPPAGLTNEGYGAEVRWDVDRLVTAGYLIPGHTYRFQFMVHDGDQNKSGGDVGEACTTISLQPPPPDLQVSKTLTTPGLINVGQEISFTIRITNTGQTTLNLIPLQDWYDPTTLEFLGATPAPSTVVSGTLVWTDLTTSLGDLAPGQAIAVVTRFRALKATTTVLAATSATLASQAAGNGAPDLVAPSWNIEVWPTANCSGWQILFQRAYGSGSESWRAKVDGTVIASGTTSGNNETITGTWPSTLDLTTSHTFLAEIYEGTSWLGRSATFGNCPPPATGSIGDRVWYDLNGDKTQQTGEAGINGVKVNLYNGACPTTGRPTGTPLKTMLTAGDGNYDFTGLAAGAYCVAVDQDTLPAGVVLTTANEPLTVNLTSGQDYNAADFGYRLQSPGKTCNLTMVSGAVDQVGALTPNHSDYICVEIKPGAKLEISKVLTSAAPAYIGQEIVFAIRITNTGYTALSVVPLQDWYDPTTLEFLGATPAPSTVVSGTLAWTDLTTSLGDLAPGQAVTVVTRFRALKATMAVLAATSATLASQAAGDAAPDLVAPSWNIEVWPTASCSGWQILFQRVFGYGSESWRAKVDGTVIASGTTSGNNETITGTWPSTLDLTTSHTFLAEIYEGTSWLGRSATFGNCPPPATGSIGDRVFNDVDGSGLPDGGSEPGINGVTVQLYGGTCSAALGGVSAINLDAVTKGTAANATKLTLAHITTAAANRLMLVGVSINRETGSTDDRVTSIVYGGQTLTRLGVATDSGTTEARAEIWALTNPPAGAADLIVNFSRANADGAVVVVATFTGVNQTTPYGSFASNSGNGTGLSVAVPSASGELVFDTAMLRSEAINSVGSGQSELWRTFFNSRVGAGVSIEAGAASVTMSWTGAAAADWAMGAISLKPATGVVPTPLKTAVTAGNGNYSFTSLTAGSYCVNVDSSTVPAGPQLTTGNVPLTVTLTSGQNYTTADFGYRQLNTASIGDRVFYDLDGSGLPDGGSEPGINGVTVRLFSTTCSGVPLKTATTVGNGNYSFTGLVAGSYCVNVDPSTVPAGYQLTTGNMPLTVSLATGQSYTTADFGYRVQCPNGTPNLAIVSGARDSSGVTLKDYQSYACAEITPARATIGDYVWNDINGDGLQNDGAGRGINGVILALYRDNGNSIFEPGAGDTLVMTRTTAGDGAYQFSNMAPGVYWVDVAAQNPALNGYTFIPGAQSGPDPKLVTVGANDNYTTADFGYAGRGAIGGEVFYDWNRDGQQGPNEAPIGNVEVCLYKDTNFNGVLDGSDSKISCQITLPDGAYLFTGQIAGAYLVAQTQPTGLQSTTPNTLPVQLIVIGAGGSALDNSFGEIVYVRLGDMVFVDNGAGDHKGNGTQEPEETIGLDGIVLEYSGTNVTGDNVSGTVVTQDGGKYLVDNLLPGTYVVKAPAVYGGFLRTSSELKATMLTTVITEDLTLDFGYIYPTGVGVQAFTVTVGRRQATLNWLAIGDPAPSYHVWRADNNKGLGVVKMTTEPVTSVSAFYGYVDMTVVTGQTYWYWIEDVSDGQRYGPQAATVPTMTSLIFIPRLGN